MKILKSALLCSLLGASLAQAATNLVANGSFETGTFDGWTTVLGDPTTFVDGSSITGRQYDQATDGHWLAFFGSTQADGGASIGQQLATVPGALYTLSFDLANSNAGSPPANAFTATVGGKALFSLAGLGEQNYLRYTSSFLATAPLTSLTLAGFNDMSYLELDAVTVTAAVPEPSTFALALGGLMVLGWRLRAKR